MGFGPKIKAECDRLIANEMRNLEIAQSSLNQAKASGQKLYVD